jgi:hypothetical protein
MDVGDEVSYHNFCEDIFNIDLISQSVVTEVLHAAFGAI